MWCRGGAVNDGGWIRAGIWRSNVECSAHDDDSRSAHCSRGRYTVTTTGNDGFVNSSGRGCAVTQAQRMRLLN